MAISLEQQTNNLVSPIEDLQIAALRQGASSFEASLGGRLPVVEEIPPEEPKDIDLLNQSMSDFDILQSLGKNIPDDKLRSDAVELSLLKLSNGEGDDIQNIFTSSLEALRGSQDPSEVFKQYQDQYSLKYQKEYTNGKLDSVMAGQPVSDTPEQIRDDLKSIEEMYSGTAGKERIIADNFAAPDLPIEEVDNQVVVNTAWSMYNDYLSTQGTGDKIVSGLSLLFVPDFYKDLSDFTGGGIFSTKERLNNFVTNYRGMTAEEKLEVLPEVFDRIREATEGNPYKMAGLMTLLHSDDLTMDFAVGTVADAIDILSSATLAAGVTVAKNIVKGTKSQKKLAKLQAEKEAAAMSFVGPRMPDFPVEKELGGQLDRAMTASPYKWEEKLIGVDTTDNLGAETTKQMESLQARIKTAVDSSVTDRFADISHPDEFVQLEALTKADKDRSIGEYKRALLERAESEKTTIKNINILETNKAGFLAEYEIDGVQKTEKVFWKQDDVGDFFGENVDFKGNFLMHNAISRFVLSPDLKLNRVGEYGKSIVGDITYAGGQSSRIRNTFTAIAKDLNRGLKRKESAEVDALVLAGDEQHKVFTLRELKDMKVETKAGKKSYSDKQIENYYKKVAFNEELWKYRNHQLKQELDFLGMKEASYTVDDQVVRLIGKPHDTLQGLDLKVDEAILAPDLSSSKYLTSSTTNISEKLKEGYKIVSLAEEYSLKSGAKVRYALIRQENIKNLPDQVLHKIDGYVPRIYKPGYYFAKDIATGTTIRAFSSKKQAEAFKDNFMANNTDGDINLQVFRDREISRMSALAEDANSYGGLYTGARKSQPLLLDDTGKRPDRLSWNEAVQRSINNISEIMPINEYRLGLKQRFVNSVNALAKKEGLPYGIKPGDDWRTAPIPLSDKYAAKAMEDVRTYMIDQFKVWDNRERTFSNMIMNMSESMGLGAKGSRVAAWFASKDPLSALHAATFHSHLGFFNPRQLYIQAQNSSLAISMHPILGLPAVKDAIAMQTMVHTNNEAINGIAKIIGRSDIAEEVRLFKRSGMLDSILRTADAQGVQEGFGPGTMNAFRSAAKKGLVFYENGELFSRLVSWNIARRRWDAANKGKEITDEAIRAIHDDAFRMHINLQKANAARFQQGFQQVPVVKNITQFAQIQAKLLENVFTGLSGKGKWTRQESLSVLGGQLAFYGVLGVPIAEEVTEWMINELGMNAAEVQENYPVIAEALADGINGVLFETMGAHNQFGGDTASVLAGLDDNVLSGFIKTALTYVGNGFHEEYGQNEISFGPAVNTLRRGHDAIINSTKELMSVYAVPSLDQALKAARNSLSDIAAITSTWSNARKLVYLHANKELFDKAGNLVFGEQNLEGVNLSTQIALAMGMPADFESSYYAMKDELRSASQDLASATSDYKKEVARYLQHGNMVRLQLAKAALFPYTVDKNGNKTYGQFSELEVREAIKRVENALLDSKQQSKLDKLMRAYTDKIIKSGGRFKPGVESFNAIEFEESQR